ncbi:transcriptional regulator, ArsR family [Haloechinothrix alba]|uniref:Transcriptional regulator, ArsR family n=1 Tax=Haloechinothrix alba TaxID=664784 RepID=A0A238W7W6_9PSEU|nr:metalloregulator ArsR/SmtB family transcription factor [Haloechinothrix alba]SNR42685.1 transcriptional regulator, ArsR family [Haloechinothrix alba]
MVEASAARESIYQQFARVGKALASSKRLELIDVLAQGERTVEALAQAAALKITTASAHLQTMHQSGLVTNRKVGNRVYYRLAGTEVLDAFAAVQRVAHSQLAATERATREFLGDDEQAPVGRAELADILRTGPVVVVDVRGEEEFDAGHIDGALCLPFDRLTDHIGALPDDVEIVVYGRSAYCARPYAAVRLLRSKGKAARRLDGGLVEWLLERRPTIPTRA